MNSQPVKPITDTYTIPTKSAIESRTNWIALLICALPFLQSPEVMLVISRYITPDLLNLSTTLLGGVILYLRNTQSNDVISGIY